ncbi:MAG: hypothetical protein EA001_00325 [Oscillatoriales cyanobacterium]|nr:MAG: hypothetical protein EA001_00325 [Oscillatoriales cyanobacterium]
MVFPAFRTNGYSHHDFQNKSGQVLSLDSENLPQSPARTADVAATDVAATDVAATAWGKVSSRG